MNLPSIKSAVWGVTATLCLPLLAIAGAPERESNGLKAWQVPGGGAPPAMSLERDADPMSRFVAGRRYLIGAAGSGEDALVKKGLALISSAARDGFAPAARFAGALYLEGMLVPRDLERGVSLLTIAAEAGDPESQRELGDLLAEGEEAIRDISQAVQWYRAVLNNPQADPTRDRLFEVQVRLASLLADGIGAKASPEEAVALLKQAAEESNYPPAWRYLGDAYASGMVGNANPKAAINAYKHALDAYRTVGLKFSIGRHTAHREGERIVAQMATLGASNHTLKKVRAQLALMN